MKRRRLILRREAVRVLREAELKGAVGGMQEVTESCWSDYTNCPKYCSDAGSAPR